MNKATFIQEIVPEKILYYAKMMFVVSKHVHQPC